MVEIPGEIGALHLAVGNDVEAGLFHVHDGQVDRVLERFFDVGRTHLARFDRLAHHPHPARDAVAADGLGGD